MVGFAEEREDWLRTKLELAHGIPSHDTFNRVLQVIDPEQLSQALGADGAVLLEHVEGQLISLDGKKLRGVSPHSKGTGGLYILSAWVSEPVSVRSTQLTEALSSASSTAPAVV